MTPDIHDARAPDLGEMAAPEPDDAERMADLIADFEAAMKIIEADEQLSAAWAEAKAVRAQLTQVTAMYDSKCAELATMTREAQRHMRRAQALEKKLENAR